MNSIKIILSTLLFAIVSACATLPSEPSHSDDSINANDDSDTIPLIKTDQALEPLTYNDVSIPSFWLNAEEPALSRGPSWNYEMVSIGAIVLYEGLLHMLYYGMDGSENQPSTKKIGYAVSRDGYNWLHAMNGPVEFTSQPAYLAGNLIVSSVLVEPDGTWVMYFYCHADDRGARWSIGRATAPDPTGPWTPEDAPVLMPGNPARWDGIGIIAPNVVKIEDAYLMYYTGYEGSPSGYRPLVQIGMAVSPDGINWVKYDDPDTQDSALGDSDPVLTVGQDGTWDSSAVTNPQVIRTAEGWMMLYLGQRRDQFVLNTHVGLAISVDGINWQRHDGNPVFDPFDETLLYSFSAIYWLYYHDTHFFFFSANNNTTEYADIYLAVSE